MLAFACYTVICPILLFLLVVAGTLDGHKAIVNQAAVCDQVPGEHYLVMNMTLEKPQPTRTSSCDRKRYNLPYLKEQEHQERGLRIEKKGPSFN